MVKEKWKKVIMGKKKKAIQTMIMKMDNMDKGKEVVVCSKNFEINVVH